MTSVKTRSAAFTAWMKQYMNGSELDEAAYDQAVLEAEYLEHRREVSQGEWLEMVRRANEALIRCS